MNYRIFLFKGKCSLGHKIALLSLPKRWTFPNKNPLHLLHYKALSVSIMHFERILIISNFVVSKFIKKGGLFK